VHPLESFSVYGTDSSYILFYARCCKREKIVYNIFVTCADRKFWLFVGVYLHSLQGVDTVRTPTIPFIEFLFPIKNSYTHYPPNPQYNIMCLHGGGWRRKSKRWIYWKLHMHVFSSIDSPLLIGFLFQRALIGTDDLHWPLGKRRLCKGTVLAVNANEIEDLKQLNTIGHIKQTSHETRKLDLC